MHNMSVFPHSTGKMVSGKCFSAWIYFRWALERWHLENIQRVRFTGTTNTLHILCGDTVHNGLALLAQPVTLKAGGPC